MQRSIHAAKTVQKLSVEWQTLHMLNKRHISEITDKV